MKRLKCDGIVQNEFEWPLYATAVPSASSSGLVDTSPPYKSSTSLLSVSQSTITMLGASTAAYQQAKADRKLKRYSETKREERNRSARMSHP